MTFRQATAKLRKIADGRHCYLRKGLVTYSTGGSKYDYDIYLDGFNFYHGDTWEESFEKLEEAIKIKQEVSCSSAQSAPAPN